jgi:hypothetical protein
MNVLSKTKKWFPGPIKDSYGRAQRHPQFQQFLGSWSALLASPTEELYNQQLAEIVVKYPVTTISYCTSTWLIWKENLVAAWIDQYYHFGVTVTSPIEGCHATLKGYLQRGHGDLRDVFHKLELYWTSQQANIQTSVGQKQLKPRHSTNIPLFAAVLKHVYGHALQRILLEQAKLPTRGPPANPPYPACECLIRQSHGLPCHHLI